MTSSGGVDRYAVLTQMSDKARDKWDKMQEQRLSDLLSALPASVSKDSVFVSSLMGKIHTLMRQEMKEAFETTFKDINVEEKMKELDHLVEEQANNGVEKKAWRPSGNAFLDQAALDTPCLLSACATLEPELTASNAEVKALMDEAEKLQNEISQAEKEIEECISA